MRRRPGFHRGLANVLNRPQRAAGEQLFHVGRDHDAVVFGDADQRDQPDPNGRVHLDAEKSQADHAPRRSAMGICEKIINVSGRLRKLR